MKVKQLQQAAEVYALVFEIDDEVISTLTQFAQQHEISAAHFTAIGAFSEATLAFFDWQSKDYKQIPVREQAEVLTLLGDVAIKDGKPSVHAHVVLGLADGTTRGGHLSEARVRPTLELILTRSPAHLRKRYNPETGLALIDPDSEA